MNLRTTIEQAIQSGDLEAISHLLTSHGADALRLDDSPGELTALHWAAAAGHRPIVEFLLSPAVGSDPRAARDNRFTPLHGAAMHGHTGVCELLLKAGADPNARTEPQLYAPLHSAAFAGHVSTIKVLLAAGADPTLRNYRNERPAETATRQNQLVAAACFSAVPSHTIPPSLTLFQRIRAWLRRT